MEQDHVIYRDEFKDKLTLDPIGKYSKYGKFPYKLMVHLALILLTSISIEYTHSNFTPFSRSQDQEWLSIFYNDQQVSSGNGIYTFYQLYDFQTHLISLFENIVSFNKNYFQQINIDSLEIYFQYIPAVLDQPYSIDKFSKILINPAEGITEPFNLNDIQSIKKFLSQTSNFVIQIPNLQVTLAQHSIPYTCWSFNIQYNFLLNTFVNSVLSSNGKVCTEYLQEKFTSVIFEGSQKFLSMSILILAVVSSMLAFKYLFDMIRDYMLCKQKGQILSPVVNENYRTKIRESQGPDSSNEEGDNLLVILSEQRPWQALTFEEKSQYFDLWFIVILIGNFCQAYAALFILLQNNHEDNVSILSQSFMWAQGFGCAFAWLSSLKYFNYVSEYNVTAELVHKSFPKIGKHFMGFVPILMSFVIVGISSFGRSQRFATFRDTFATLFSLLLGDSIHDITLDLEANGASPVLAIMYITSFIVIFILSVNNVMVAIIQDESDIRRKKMEELKAFKLLQKSKKNLQQKDVLLRKGGSPDELKSINGLPSSFSEESPKKTPDQRQQDQESLRVIKLFKNDSELLQTPAIRGIRRIDSQQADGKASRQQSPNKRGNVGWKTENDLEKEQPIEDQREFEQTAEDLRKSRNEVNEQRISWINASQRQEISMQALSKVARKLTKKATMRGDEQVISSQDIGEQISREVDILIEQKLTQKNIYSKFIHGFTEISKLLDKQAYEIKDNLYLYRLTKEQQALIKNKYIDTLKYFSKLTNLPPDELAE